MTHRQKILATSEYDIHTQLANQRNKSVLEINQLEKFRHSKIESCAPFNTIEVVDILETF